MLVVRVLRNKVATRQRSEGPNQVLHSLAAGKVNKCWRNSLECRREESIHRWK